MEGAGAQAVDTWDASDLRRLHRQGRSLLATLLQDDRLALIAAGLTFGAAQAPGRVEHPLETLESWTRRVNQLLQHAPEPLQRQFRDTPARRRHGLSSDAAHAAKLLRDRLDALDQVLAQIQR